jgi:sequestosome 1
MNAFQIKCYLFPENVRVSVDRIGEANEIRRFALTSTPFGIYQQLIEKVQAAYGDLLAIKDEIKTYWLDEENELVGFTTDSEMQYAIDLQTAIRVSKPYESAASSFSSASVFKVYIVKRTAKQASENNSEPLVHPGVVCDGCDGSVVGTRYKCSVRKTIKLLDHNSKICFEYIKYLLSYIFKTCKDYDLCSTCESKGIHKEHTFAKITRPGAKCPFSGRNRGGLFGNRCRRNMPSSQSFQESMNNFVPLITNNIPIVNDPEQLKNFGEFMKQFLDPFGIDVDYYVSKATEGSEQKAEEAKKSEEESNMPSTSASASKTDLLTGSKIEEKSQEQAQAEASSMLSPETVHVPTAPSTSQSLLDTDMATFEMAASALKSKIEENGKQREEAARKSEDEDSGFNLVDIEKELKYISSIEQLKSMGYNDEGGWLTRLVIAKNGNINAVLDALNPSMHK